MSSPLKRFKNYIWTQPPTCFSPQVIGCLLFAITDIFIRAYADNRWFALIPLLFFPWTTLAITLWIATGSELQALKLILLMFAVGADCNHWPPLKRLKDSTPNELIAHFKRKPKSPSHPASPDA